MLQLIFTLECSNFKAIPDIKREIFQYFGSRCILNDGGEFNTMTLTLDVFTNEDKDRLIAICNNVNTGVFVIHTDSNIPIGYSELCYEDPKGC